MEPDLIVVEDCDTYFIVQQRWGYSGGGWTCESMGQPTNDSHGLRVHETAFIFSRVATYAAAYQQWVRYDNGNRTKMRFGYIVEARNKGQVVNVMLARGHASQFRNKMLYPHGFNAYYNQENQMDICCPRCGCYPCQREAQCSKYNPNTGELNTPGLAPRTEVQKLTRVQMSLLKQASDLQDQIDRINAMPKEPEAKGDNPNVITFEKRFQAGGRLYSYAAIKAGDGLWYTTGPRTPKGFTWEALIQWIYEVDDQIVLKAGKFSVIR